MATVQTDAGERPVVEVIAYEEGQFADVLHCRSLVECSDCATPKKSGRAVAEK